MASSGIGLGQIVVPGIVACGFALPCDVEMVMSFGWHEAMVDKPNGGCAA